MDLSLRAKYPYLKTTIYRVNKSEFSIHVDGAGEDFENINSDFERSIKLLGAPVSLADLEPVDYEGIVQGISDLDIPCNFVGLPFTNNQLRIHIECVYPGIVVSEISIDECNRVIEIELFGRVSGDTIDAIQESLFSLGLPIGLLVTDGGAEKMSIDLPNEGVFNIASSTSLGDWDPGFLDRDERLWYDNVDDIYRGSFKKDDLYFYDASKTSCLVDFSVFKNCNLKNHILLYDVVYCILPLQGRMSSFLQDQKLSREDILYLVERGRLKVLNIQPEHRLDMQFVKDIYAVNSTAVVSRRAIAAMCAMDIVDMNSSYIFSDNECEKVVWPILKSLLEQTNFSISKIASFLFWPKYALRNSFDVLNTVGPQGIARYGVNDLAAGTFPSSEQSKLEFDFVVNSRQVHLAHALDATYFPYFADDSKYSDFPFASMMGNLLNFYRCANRDNIGEEYEILALKENGNRTLELISLIEINDYMPIHEFEKGAGGKVARSGLNTLFSELRGLTEEERIERIEEYNHLLDEMLKRRAKHKTWLELGEDAVGIYVPFISTGKKLLSWFRENATSKYPAIQAFSEFIESKMVPTDKRRSDISLLSKINRVARLRRKYD